MSDAGKSGAGGGEAGVPLAQAAARGTRVTLVSQLARVILQFGSVAVLARLLTPEDFGLVAMVAALLGAAEIIRDAGLSSAAVQATVLTRDEQTNLFWVSTGLGIGCATVAICVQPLVVRAYGQPELGPLVLALAAVFVISGFNAQFRTDLTRSLRFKALAVSDVAAQASAIVIAIALALAGAGVWALVAQQLTTALVACCINVVNADFVPGLPRRHASIRRFVRFGSGLLGSRGLDYAVQNTDNIALGLTAGPVQLGLYSRAYQLLMTPLAQINTPLSRIALPLLARAREVPGEYVRFLSKAQLAGCYVTATVFAVAAGLSGPLVAVLFGPQWDAVAPVFAVLAIGGVFRAVQQLAYWMYVSSGRTGAQLRLFLVTQPLMVLLIVAGVPWGAMGVAVGHSVGYCGFWLVSLAHAGRSCGVPVGGLYRNALRALLLVAAPAGGAAALGTLVQAPALVQIVVGVTAAGIWLLLVRAASSAVRTDMRSVTRLALRVAGRQR